VQSVLGQPASLGGRWPGEEKVLCGLKEKFKQQGISDVSGGYLGDWRLHSSWTGASSTP
jgi:hypothetical protein